MYLVALILDSLRFGFAYLPTYLFFLTNISMYQHKKMVSVPARQPCGQTLASGHVPCHVVCIGGGVGIVFLLLQLHEQFHRVKCSIQKPPFALLIRDICSLAKYLVSDGLASTQKPSWAVTKTTLLLFQHCGEHSSASPSIFVSVLLYFIHVFLPPTRLCISQSFAVTEIYCTAKC